MEITTVGIDLAKAVFPSESKQNGDRYSALHAYLEELARARQNIFSQNLQVEYDA